MRCVYCIGNFRNNKEPYWYLDKLVNFEYSIKLESFL